MLVQTIKDYTDKETKKIYRTTDEELIREVSGERGEELISKGVVVKVESEKKEEVIDNNVVDTSSGESTETKIKDKETKKSK